MLFQDRKDAGQILAASLMKYQNHPKTLVIGLARGGVVVAYEVAKKLSLPLYAIVPRKIGAPGNPELALGSIMENGEGVFNQSLIEMLGVSKEYIKEEIKKEQALAKRRVALYSPNHPLPDVKNYIVIIVDDGIATGSTMLSAVKSMRKSGAVHITVAAPVASTEANQLLEEVSDEIICPYILDNFMSVGSHYLFFDQTSDEEVVRLLRP